MHEKDPAEVFRHAEQEICFSLCTPIYFQNFCIFGNAIDKKSEKYKRKSESDKRCVLKNQKKSPHGGGTRIAPQGCGVQQGEKIQTAKTTIFAVFAEGKQNFLVETKITWK